MNMYNVHCRYQNSCSGLEKVYNNTCTLSYWCLLVNDNLLHIHSDVLSEREGLWDVVDPGVSGSARVETSISCVNILYHQPGVCVLYNYVCACKCAHVNERCRRKKERSKKGQINNKAKQHMYLGQIREDTSDLLVLAPIMGVQTLFSSSLSLSHR